MTLNYIGLLYHWGMQGEGQKGHMPPGKYVFTLLCMVDMLLITWLCPPSKKRLPSFSPSLPAQRSMPPFYWVTQSWQGITTFRHQRFLGGRKKMGVPPPPPSIHLCTCLWHIDIQKNSTYNYTQTLGSCIVFSKVFAEYMTFFPSSL